MGSEVASGSESSVPLVDIVEEAKRVLRAAADRSVPIRLLGGIAVYLHSERLPDMLCRAYKDIDLATIKGKRQEISRLMTDLGYEPAVRFNGLNGHRRLLFYDTVNERQVDVFVGEFEMCHTIPITERLMVHDQTLPPAELLMMKLQVVQLNEKDLRDIVALLHEHDVTDHDEDAINGRVIARRTAADWGLWRTIKLNLERLRTGLPDYGLGQSERQEILDRADRLWAVVEAEPKSAKWRLRDRVGDRKRWYEEPDEVG